MAGAWQDLDEVLQLEVLRRLDGASLARCAGVCRHWAALAGDQRLWRALTLTCPRTLSRADLIAGKAPGPARPRLACSARVCGGCKPGNRVQVHLYSSVRIARLPPDCMIALGGCYGYPAAGVEKQTIHWVMSTSQPA